MRSDIKIGPLQSAQYPIAPGPSENQFCFSRFGLCVPEKTIPLGIFIELDLTDGWILGALARNELSPSEKRLLPSAFKDFKVRGSILTYLQRSLQLAVSNRPSYSCMKGATYLGHIRRSSRGEGAESLDLDEIHPNYLGRAGISATSSIEEARAGLDTLLEVLSQDPFLDAPLDSPRLSFLRS